MRTVHAIGYALGAVLASTFGVAVFAHSSGLTLWQSMGIVGVCAALGAYVGWNRLPRP